MRVRLTSPGGSDAQFSTCNTPSRNGLARARHTSYFLGAYAGSLRGAGEHAGMGAVYLPEDLANLRDAELAERLEKAWYFYDTANQEIESWSRLRPVLDKFIYMSVDSDHS